MTGKTAQERLALKTPEAAFYQTLRDEFNFSVRMARDVLNAAQEMLVGSVESEKLRPGQIRRVVAQTKAPFGPPLSETAKVEVTLTVDAGAEDVEVEGQQGREALRRGRILRLIEEALEQGGVLTQEDLGHVLGVDVRTIRRDVRVLKEEGQILHTRGQLKGVGRGQTHKVRIIQMWLDRDGYDKIARGMHHSPQAIQRYVSTFLRMVSLHEEGKALKDIAFLTQSSTKLVEEYLAVYENAREHPTRQVKLAEEIERVSVGKCLQQQLAEAEASEKGGMST